MDKQPFRNLIYTGKHRIEKKLESDENRYFRLRKECSQQIHEAKKTYFSNLFENSVKISSKTLTLIKRPTEDSEKKTKNEHQNLMLKTEKTELREGTETSKVFNRSFCLSC